MSDRDEKLSTDFVEASILAIAEHLNTLKMDLPPQDIDMMHPKTGEVSTVPNPLWIKLKTLKSRAASDVLNIMRAVDPQSMKGRKTDRLESLIKGVMAWSPSTKPQ